MRKGLLALAGVVIISGLFAGLINHIQRAEGNGLKGRKSVCEKVRLELPKGDLSEYFKTTKLQDAAAMVSGKNISLLADLVTVRIPAFFVHGKFGTMQQILYHPDAFEHKPGYEHGGRPRKGEWAMYPFFRREDKSTSSMEWLKGETPAVLLDEKNNRIEISGKDMKWVIGIKDDHVSCEIEAPEGSTFTGMAVNLYPLFTHYLSGTGEKTMINYTNTVAQVSFVGEKLFLIDETMQMPGLEITVPGGRIELAGYHLTFEAAQYGKEGNHLSEEEPKQSTPYGLRINAFREGRAAQVTMRVIPNPITIWALPLTPAGNKLTIRVRTETGNKPEIFVDGNKITFSRKWGLHSNKKEEWFSAEVEPEQQGRHEIRVERDGYKAIRHLYAVEDFRKATIKMAEALLRIQENTGNKYPGLKDMISSVVTYDFQPKWNPPYQVAAYMPRTTMSLAAATLASGERKYVDAGFRSLEAYLAKSPRNPYGKEGIFVPGAFDRDGKIVDPVYDAQGNIISCYYNRPSNFAIMIRGLIYCHDVFEYIGDKEKAGKALALGIEVTKGLESTYGVGWKYVNNPHYSLARFTKRLEKELPADGAYVREFLEGELKSKGYDREPLPAIRIASSKGHEATPNTEQDVCAIVSELLAKQIFSQREDCSKAATDLAKMTTLEQPFFAGLPEGFGSSVAEPNLPQYVGGYNNVMLFGGVWDLVRMEILVASAEQLGDVFMRDAASYLFMARLAWSLEKNGMLCGAVQKVPGVTYRNTRFVETLNWGAPGIYAYWYFSRLCGLEY